MNFFNKTNISIHSLKMQTFKVISCPTTELSFTNKAIVSPGDPFAEFNHIAVRYPKKNDAYVFSVTSDKKVGSGQMAFNLTSRKWAQLSTDTNIEAAPYQFDVKSQSLHAVTFYADFASKQNVNLNTDFDTDEMAKQLGDLYRDQALTVGQLIGFPFELGNRRIVLELKVKELDALSYSDSDAATLAVEIGLIVPNTVFMFEAAHGSEIRLTGKLTGGSAPQIFDQNWDFSSMGIGGLGEQFNQLFRRAFASRLLPPKLAEEIGVTQVRGILLHGPPGTGKTLIARQIGKMLLAREPKVVNGPEVLNKYVGESEANIRKLFQEAEEEQAKCGINSGLHMIIFDEIDAICKARGSNPSSAGVGDNVVNQLLSKIDGVNALSNVLLIGMTNRKDLIDEALLRPGRFEVQIEIGLPNKSGRREILEIHTKKMRDANIMDKSVDLDEMAEISKNFTGAEIAGLVKAAMSRAINRVVSIDTKVVIDESKLKDIKLKREDMIQALEHDVKPALGKSEDRLNVLAKPMISWDPIMGQIQQELSEVIDLAKAETNGMPYFILLRGEPNVGLTTIAANMSMRTNFPFIQVYSSEITDGESEMVKIQHLKKLFQNAARSELSCIVLDDLENVLDYIHIGPTFSRNITIFFRKLKDYILPHNHRMLVICTCKTGHFIKQLQLIKMFRHVIEIPTIDRPEQIGTYLYQLKESGDCPFSPDQIQQLIHSISQIRFEIGIKTLEILTKNVSNQEPDQRVRRFLNLLQSMD